MPTEILGRDGITSNSKVAIVSDPKGDINVVMADGTVDFFKHGEVLSAKYGAQFNRLVRKP